MHVVNLGELSLNLSGQPMGERGGDLLKDVCRGSNSLEYQLVKVKDTDEKMATYLQSQFQEG